MPVAAQHPPTAVACPACGFALALDAFAGSEEIACPHCRVALSGTLFPTFWQEGAGASLADHALDGDAACFFHPENRAVLSCERCGRFLCTVCDMPLGTRHLCPTCLSSGLTGEKLQELVISRFIWSNMALLCGLVPLILGLFVFPMFIVTGPAAIFCALFGWKRPGSLPRGRRRWVSVLGLVCGLLQLAIWFGFIVMLSNSPAWRSNFG
jgi:hypothetical protein